MPILPAIVLFLSAVLLGAQQQQQQSTTRPATTQAAINPALDAAPREHDAWKQLNDAINARTAEGREMGNIDLLFVGDSITQAWAGPGREAWDKHFAPGGAANLGIGGDQTQHVIWRMHNGNLEGLAKPAAGRAPRLAIVMIGTNNLGVGHAPEQVAEGVKGVIDSIRKELPETKVLLLAILPRGEKFDDPLRLAVAETNELLPALADGKTVHFLDTGAIFIEEDGSISKEIMPDFLHLSPRAYAMWAEAIAIGVKQVLEE
jgi:lysophospholipase L1-like esterase